MKKIIFLDMDGTLVGANGYIPASAVKACQDARKRGHLLYICSGRNMAELGGDILKIGFDGIASSGGAHIETGGKAIFDAVMPVALSKQIATYLDDRQCGFAMEKNHTILSNQYYLSFWGSILDRLQADGKTDTFVSQILHIIKDPLPENYQDSCYEGVNKIVFVGNGNGSASFASVKQAFGQECEIFLASMPHSNDEGGEIGPLGVHKGSAIIEAAKYHGIPIADTVVFGDSNNDQPMFECAGTKVAMGNAKDSIKAMADYVTSSLDDDGIFNGFKKLGLI
ncbi:MAG: HAD family hydrolase [Treponema sp.]|nr:HAD family hydrolase [Treponema sp.]